MSATVRKIVKDVLRTDWTIARARFAGSPDCLNGQYRPICILDEHSKRTWKIPDPTKTVYVVSIILEAKAGECLPPSHPSCIINAASATKYCNLVGT